MRRDRFVIGCLFFLFISSIFLSVYYREFRSDDHGHADLGSMKKGIAVVDLFGPISFRASSQAIIPMGADSVISQLQSFQDDKRVKALVLRINSPGGTVGASQEIYQAILAFKAATNVPVIASIGDVGASGAYYAAMAADTIFANPGSLVGSIGVILGNINIKELAEKHGVGFNAYKSGEYKDTMSMWRSPEKNESILLQNLVDNVYEQFLNSLMANRQLTRPHAERIAQGQIFSGEQALNEQLVDQLGGLTDALSYTATLVGIKGKPLILSNNKPRFEDLMTLWQEQLGNRFLGSFFSIPSVELR